MTTAIRMPQFTETMVEGVVGKWLKGEGDWVKREEPLVEIVTDKVTVEMPSPVEGKLARIITPEDTVVRVGGELAIMEDVAETAPAPLRTPPSQAAPPMAPPPPVPSQERAERYSPAARPAAPQEEELLPITPVRRLIANHMVRSIQTAPHVWAALEVDVTLLVQLRESLKDGFRQREGAQLTYLPFAIRAVAEALKEHPILNSSWSEEHIILKKRIHIGIATATGEGLVVPVIKDAHTKSIAALAREADRLAGKARLSRSAFVRHAVETALRQPAETEALRKARQIYADIAEEDRALAKVYLPLVAETLPPPYKRRRR